MDGTFPNGLRYTAYGQKAWQTGGDWQPVDFLFAGESGYITEYSDEQNPGVALLYLQQRYYDPDIGRFLTPDPIGFAGGLNLYAYCGNDPVNRVDPLGLADWQTGSYLGDVKLALKVEAQALNPVNVAKGGVALVKRAQQVGPEEAGKELCHSLVETYKGIWTGEDIETKAQSGAVWAVTLAPTGAKVLSATREVPPRATPIMGEIGGRAGRGGKQPRLRALGDDPEASSAMRGWVKQETNAIAAGKRSRIRVPPNKVLAHRRGKEAKNGNGYEHSVPQDADLHKLQHRFEGYK